MADEIDCVELVDGLIRDCLAAKIPPYPRPIAEALSLAFCQQQSAASHAVMLVELTALVRERLEFLAATQTIVN